jgi:hypothetical protein
MSVGFTGLSYVVTIAAVSVAGGNPMKAMARKLIQLALLM